MKQHSKVGLTLGKFAPFHKGHQYVIETAIQEVDELIVLVYDDPITTISLPIRANWIRKLYPNVTVIEGVNSPNDSGYTLEIMEIQDNYILQVLGNRKITHFYSSEPYGEHVSRALQCMNRQVDLERLAFPISATKIRINSFENKNFIDPIVYKDLITKIVFLGAPSTGKTTLCEKLATRFNTKWMPEYGREYWENHQVNKRLTLKDLLKIAETHIEKENELLFDCNKYLFSDTNAITTYLFSLDYHGKAMPKLENLAKIAQDRHDIIFVCDTDIPYQDTWDRSGDVKRKEFQQKILDDLAARNLKYELLQGSLEKRMQTVTNIIQGSKYNKFN